jgi:hypothetical protein
LLYENKKLSCKFMVNILDIYVRKDFVIELLYQGVL